MDFTGLYQGSCRFMTKLRRNRFFFSFFFLKAGRSCSRALKKETDKYTSFLGQYFRQSTFLKNKLFSALNYCTRKERLWWLFSRERGFWENVRPFIPCLYSLCRDQSTDFGWVFPDELRVSSFPDRFPHHAQTAAVSSFRLRWDKDVCAFTCNLPPALLAE